MQKMKSVIDNLMTLCICFVLMLLFLIFIVILIPFAIFAPEKK